MVIIDKWIILVFHKDNEFYKKVVNLVENITVSGKGFEVIQVNSVEEVKAFCGKQYEISILLMSLEKDTLKGKLEFVKYIRSSKHNDLTSVNLIPDDDVKHDLFELIKSGNLHAYVETSELTDEKIVYLIISGAKYYEKLSVLHNNNIIISNILETASAKRDFVPLNEVIIQSFSKLKKVLKSMNFDINGVAFVNDNFLASSPNFLKFKKLKGKEFLQLLNLSDETLNDNKRTVLFNNSLLVSTKNHDVFMYFDFHNSIPDSLKRIISLYANDVRIVIENLKLRKELQDSSMKIIFLLSELVENKSAETGDHVKRVMLYTEILSKGLGIGKDLTYEFKIASMLHDIGKIGIPDSILLKPGRLTPQEFEVMKTHTTIGYNILKISEDTILKKGSIIARYHHENFDGSGYPTGIKASEIPIDARIVSLADYYDALSSDRVYRKAWREKDVLDSIKELKNKKFDPKVVDTFFDNYDKIIGARMAILHRNHPQFAKKSNFM